MEIVLNILLAALNSAFLFIIMHEILRLFCSPREEITQYYMLLLCGFILVASLISLFVPSIFVTFSIGLVCFALTFLFKSKVILKVVIVIIVVGLSSIGQVIVSTLYATVTSENFSLVAIATNNFADMTTNSLLLLLDSLLVKLCILIVLKALMVSRRKAITYFDIKLVLAFALLITSAFAMNFVVYQLVQNFEEYSITMFAMTISLSIMLANALVAYLIDSSSAQMEKLREEERVKKQIDSETEYYKSIVSQYSEAKTQMHDFKNKVFAFYANADNFNENAQSELEKLYKNMTIDESITLCSDEAMNALLNSKRKTMLDSSIKFRASICDIESANISQSDLCVLVGNLVDNAIEACQKVDKVKRKISVDIMRREDNFIIDICNSCISGIDVTNLKSSKKDSVRHGIGLKSVKTIAIKYGGDINFYCEGGKFSCIARFNLSK